MKYPLFYKDHEGHYRRIPYNLMTIFPDGKVGVASLWAFERPGELVKFLKAVPGRWRYDPTTDRLILSEAQDENQNPDLDQRQENRQD